ncbi:MAG: pantoate--beta-alanine ligase [Rhodospirillales bacterium]|nr:pantoate--beta-alanine ligase [Rhodospirillales bacterium]
MTTALVAQSQPLVLRTISDLRAFVKKQRSGGKRIALVPTMGALHEGHLTLAREGLKRADLVITTIFVNPTQFGPNEDFDAYPRTLEADVEKLAGIGVQAVFVPAVEEMYPKGAMTNVFVKGVTETLEGLCRPGHFDGVATIVTKLLLQALPDIALFGEKDYQQLQVIKRLSADLDIPAEIIGVPTVREESGLALSSRNAYLSPEQKEIAVALSRTLKAMSQKIAAGEPLAAVQSWGKARIEGAGFDKIDYLEIRDAVSLQPVSEKGAQPLRVLVAAFLGKARLIDNVAA